MRRLLFPFAVLFVLPLLGSDSPKEYDDRATHSGLDGTWRAVEVNWSGERQKPTFPSLVLRNGTFVLGSSDGDSWKGIYRTDASFAPPRLILVLENGAIWNHIYQQRGDTLRTASKWEQRDGYPKGFQGGTDVVVTVYRREPR